MPLKDAFLRTVKPQAKAQKYADGGGLYLYVSPSGGKLWRMDYTLEGRRKTASFGAYPAVSLKDARMRRDDAKAMIAQGIDPVQEKKRVKLEAAAERRARELTFRLAAMDWLGTQKQANAERTRKGIEGRLNLHIFPIIGSKPLVEVTFDDLRAILRRLEGQGKYEMAKRVCHILSQICRYARLNKWTAHNIAEDLSAILEKRPADDQKGFPAVTSPEGVAEILRRIQRYVDTGRSSPYMNAALQLYPYTALRAQELFLARWEDIDFVKQVWRIPAENTKTRKAFERPLSRQTLSILQGLLSYRAASGFVFNSGRGHLQGESINKAMHTCGIPKGEHCLHGWRKTFSTLVHEAGCPAVLVERGLSHKSGDETALTYNKAAYMEPLRIVFQWWSDYLDALRDGTDLPVLSLDRAAMFA